MPFILILDRQVMQYKLKTRWKQYFEMEEICWGLIKLCPNGLASYYSFFVYWFWGAKYIDVILSNCNNHWGWFF